ANDRILASYSVNSANLPAVQYLQAFDQSTQEPLGRQTIDTGNYYNYTTNPVQRLFRFGKDGVIVTSINGLLVFHTPLAGPGPQTSAAEVVNAASQLAGPIAQGEILTVYGQNLGPANPQTAALNVAGRFDAALGGVQVWFGRSAGTVLLGYAGQLNVIVPFEV